LVQKEIEKKAGIFF